jgi:hypothetical protein
VTVRYKGLTVVRNPDITVVTFPNGSVTTVTTTEAVVVSE